MSCHIKSVGLNRIEVAKFFFIAYSDRAQSICKSIRTGMIVFSHQIRVLTNDAQEDPTDFQKTLNSIKAGGGTVIADAIQKAIQLLVQAKQTYKNAQLRIVLLTDGEDGSILDKYALLGLCCQHQILIDSFLIDNSFDKNLVALTRLSGGCAFF